MKRAPYTNQLKTWNNLLISIGPQGKAQIRALKTLEKRAMTSQDKPWAKLRISRKQYAAGRPWKKAGMDKKTFENVILALPDSYFDALKLEADAEKLLGVIFNHSYEK